MKTYEGGCHCGRVRYTVEADIANVISCNCSHCNKKGLLLTFVPAGKFTLSTGEGELASYRFNKHVIEHVFCRTCGVQSFSRGKGPDGSDTVAINVRCLDGVDTTTLAVTHYDGKSR